MEYQQPILCSFEWFLDIYSEFKYFLGNCFLFFLLQFCYKLKNTSDMKKWLRTCKILQFLYGQFKILEYAVMFCSQLSARTSLTQNCSNYLAFSGEIPKTETLPMQNLINYTDVDYYPTMFHQPYHTNWHILNTMRVY